MRSGALDAAGPNAPHTRETARALHALREAALTGDRSGPGPRAVIGASWQRMLRIGVDPDRGTSSALLRREDLEHRRRATPLGTVLPVLSEGLLAAADASMQIVVVTDDEGRVLWRDGNKAVIRRANGICLEEGSAWSEESVGTNAVGTVLETGLPQQVHSAEHFVRALHRWTCAAAPVHDPRDGRLLGVVDVSGPDSAFHPSMPALVGSVARLAAAELRHRHLASVDRLRSVASPVLSRVGGRALAVDAYGWPAAVTGMPPIDRLPLPKSFAAGRMWLPSLGMCTVEQLPGGWLIRVDDESTEPGDAARGGRVVLDLSGRRRWWVTVSGPAGDWTQELTPRHAELLYVLSLHPGGRTAAELAGDLFGDPTRTVTVRAEMSRVRRRLAEVLAHRPYRFSEGVEVRVVRPEPPADLLPHSTAPAVRRPGPPAV